MAMGTTVKRRVQEGDMPLPPGSIIEPVDLPSSVIYMRVIKVSRSALLTCGIISGSFDT